MRSRITAFVLCFLCVFYSIAFAQSSEPTLKILETTSYWEGNFVIVGLIQNNLSYTATFVELGLECWDDKNNLVQTESTYAECGIPPGWKIPFIFLISKYEASDIRKYRVSIADYSKGSPPKLDFTISKLIITEKNSAYHKYSGYVTNNTKQTLKYVKVVIIGYNTSGSLSYIGTSYSEKSTLSPGDQSVIEFLIPPELSASISKYSAFGYAD